MITCFSINGRLFHKCYFAVQPIEIRKEKMSSKIFPGIFTRSIQVGMLVPIILVSFSPSVVAFGNWVPMFLMLVRWSSVIWKKKELHT